MRFDDVEIGDEVPSTRPDVSVEQVRLFVRAADMDFPRFTDHEQARREGLPGAVVPGIMSQGLLATMIHAWAPNARVRQLDTVFRSPVIVGSQPTCSGAVTDVDDERRVIEIDLTMLTDDGVTSVLGTAVVELEG